MHYLKLKFDFGEIFMNKSILITGVPGSGKSSIVNELNKRGYKAYDIESIRGLFANVDKETGKVIRNHSDNDLEQVKRRDWVCNKKKLRKLLSRNKTGVVFYSGTASNIDELLPLFDKVFLLKASRETIRRRLSKRTSKSFGNNPEIRKWVLSWKGWWENHMRRRGAVTINANHSVQKIATDILGKI